MRSTGEVLGLSQYWGEAFFKAQEGIQSKLPVSGKVLISVSDKDKPEVVEVAKSFEKNGFEILASKNTCRLLVENGVKAEEVKKLKEGRPNMMDIILNGEVDLIINTPIGSDRANDDSYLRKAAIKKKIPYMTTMAAAKATASGINTIKERGNSEVKSIQELHAEINDK